MAEVFSCSWVACLDESMSLWLNRWTCPGWTFVPRKPWSMGNEYHSMCCGMTSIMFANDLVEGSDRPKELPSLDPENKGPTVSLLLRICKPLYTKGTIVILDSGFCVLKGIVELMKKGFVNKKRAILAKVYQRGCYGFANTGRCSGNYESCERINGQC